MTKPNAWTRRRFVNTAATTGALAAAAGTGFKPGKVFAQSGPIELVHWSWLTASDGEVWAQMIDSFNEAHKDKNVQIRMEVVPYEEYPLKVLASVATGQAPDFGWGTAGLNANFAKDGATVPLDDLAGEAGLDLADFSESSITASRYPQYDNQLFMVPMDLMSLQPELNDHRLKPVGSRATVETVFF